jgi:hypothetical protein
MPASYPSTRNRAVFLSYAREDTAGAQRIAAALRAHGVEVGFDQSELRGDPRFEALLNDAKNRSPGGAHEVSLPRGARAAAHFPPSGFRVAAFTSRSCQSLVSI